MTSASVVIVGAGVVGASVAYHLAARGLTDIVLLERAAESGRGSTGFATGGFRLQFASPVNVRLSALSRQKLLAFAEETGVDPGLRAAGYLWLATDDAQLSALRHSMTIEHACGEGGVIALDVDGAARLNPALALEGIVGGTFCPNAGFLDPRRVLTGYLTAAQRLGVHVVYDTEVVGLDRNGGGRIVRVRTNREDFAIGRVVNAAGPWAGELAALGGIDLPVAPLRRQVAVTRTFQGLPPDMPMTIFVEDGFHLRVRDGRVLLLLPSPGVPGRPFDTTVDRSWIAAVFERACARVPALRETGVDEAASYAGLYEMSPDKHAILGIAAECPNLVLVNGSSGHGVMHAPALGQLAAEILTDGKATSLDVSALDPRRFAEGRPNPADGLL